MKERLKAYLEKLKADNEVRAKELEVNFGEDYKNVTTAQKYNYTLEVIKELEDILN